ncbi:MAG: stage III sporulation protein AG, partial [Clostridium sp.]|uniref:stage III sporulation protein AG n=1 Tax=Clostridium sp. TaxID=1506 RepID=UPI002FC99BE4
MKIKEYLKKLYEDPKKFFTNVAFFLVLGVLFMLVGKTGAGLLNINSDKKSIDKPAKEIVEDSEVEVTSSESQQTTGVKDYEEKLKKDVENTLNQIAGVGKVTVAIYFEGSSESIPAVNSNDSNKKTEEKDKEGGVRTITENNKSSTVVTTGESSKSKALIVKEVRPTIGGVMIVAEGATNSSVKEDVIGAVKTLLNLPANKVFVAPMKKS